MFRTMASSITRTTMFVIMLAAAVQSQQTYRRACGCDYTADGQCAYTLLLPGPASDGACSATGRSSGDDGVTSLRDDVTQLEQNVTQLALDSGEQARLLTRLQSVVIERIMKNESVEAGTTTDGSCKVCDTLQEQLFTQQMSIASLFQELPQLQVQIKNMITQQLVARNLTELRVTALWLAMGNVIDEQMKTQNTTEMEKSRRNITANAEMVKMREMMKNLTKKMKRNMTRHMTQQIESIAEQMAGTMETRGLEVKDIIVMQTRFISNIIKILLKNTEGMASENDMMEAADNIELFEKMNEIESTMDMDGLMEMQRQALNNLTETMLAVMDANEDVEDLLPKLKNLTDIMESFKSAPPGIPSSSQQPNISVDNVISSLLPVVKELFTQYWLCQQKGLLISGSSARIADTAITASSSTNGSEPRMSRVHSNDSSTASAWCAEPNKDEWLQFDLGVARPVYGVVTRGRQDYAQWVTSYKMAYAVDPTADGWTFYKDPLEEDQVFEGNTDQNTAMTHSLWQPITARYVRLHPLPPPQPLNQCMRADLIGCVDA